VYLYTNYTRNCWGQMLSAGILYTVVYIYTVQLIYRYFGTLRVTKHFQWKRTIPKLAASHGRSRPPPNTWFIGPTRVNTPNGILIASAISLQLTIFSHYTLQWGGTCPPKLPIPLGKSGPWPNTWFLGPTRVHNPNWMSIGSAILHASQLVSNRHTHTQTDRPRYICSNRPHLMVCIVMQPNSTISFNSWLSFQWLCHLLWGWAPQQVQFNKAKHHQVSVHNTASNIDTYP